MSVWSDIKCGFSTADESVNFGTRAFAPGDDCIYEASTLASICSVDKIADSTGFHSAPHVESQMCPLGTAFAVDKTFAFLSDECRNVICSASFESVIDGFVLYNGGSSVCIGLSDFTTVRMDLQTGKRVVFPPSCFPTAKPSKILRFVCFGHDVMAVLASGMIVALDHFNDPVEFNDEDVVHVKNSSDVRFSIHNDDYDTYKLQGEISSCSDPFGAEDKIYLCDDENMYVYTKSEAYLENFISTKFLGRITKIAVTPDEKYAICRSDAGNLYVMCNAVGTFLYTICKERVIDFALVSSSIGEITGNTSLLTNILCQMESGHISLFDIEGLECTFTLPINARYTHLVSDQINFDGEMYLEGIGDQIIDTLLIKLVEQTSPEHRLQRLLQRGKFEQALEFARTYGLDKEVVLKAEVQSLMGTLPLWNRFPEETLNANFAKLREILNNIKDVEFVAEVCVKTIPPDMEKTKQLIDYTMQRLHEHHKQNGITATIEKLRNLQLTFGTFKIVCDENPTPDKWLTFSTRNPLLICKEFISQGRLREGSLVCCRHRARMQSELTNAMAIALLEEIPISTSTSDIVVWLNRFVPVLVSSDSRALPELVNFIEERTKFLERRDARNWPRNAIDFVTACLNILYDLVNRKSVSSSEVIPIQQSMCLPLSPLNRLESFLRHLKALMALLSEHHISMSYDLYRHGLEDKDGARTLLLHLFDGVYEQGIEKLITEFVPSFNMALYKDISAIIASYVNDIIARYIADKIYDAYWEARCVAFINCIVVPDDKLATVGNLAHFAHVPWSDQVTKMVDSSLLIDHPKTAPIEIEKRRIPQKLVLQKYGFNSKVSLNDVNMLILHIYNHSKDVSTMLEDATQLVAHEESLRLTPYFCLVGFSINHESVISFDDVLDILQRNLTKEDIVEVKDYATRHINCLLRLNKWSTEFCEKATPLLCKLSQTQAEPSLPQRNTAAQLRSVCALNVEHKANHSLKDLFKPNKSEILSQCVENFIRIEENLERLMIKSAEASLLVAEPEDVGLICLAEQALKMNKADIVIKALTRLCDNNRVFDTHCEDITKLLSMAVPLAFNCTPPAKKELIEALTHTALLNLVHSEECELINQFLRVSKMYTVLHVKPSWSSLYSDPIETPSIQLPPKIFSRIATSFRDELSEESEQNDIQEELMGMCQSLPKDLGSLSRLMGLFCFLARENVGITTATLKELKQATTITCRNVLMNIFTNHRVPDFRLALSLLQNFQLDQTLHWLQYVAKHKRDMKFSRNMSLVVVAYCAFHKSAISKDHELNTASRYFQQLNKVSTWSMRAYRYGIPYKEALADTVEEQMRFLNRLITVNNIELSTLESYCRDMGLDVQECYVVYIKHALLSWEPIFRIHTTHTGKTEVIFEENIEPLAVKFDHIMSKVHNPDELIKILLKKDFWDQINTYYYEVFSVILQKAASKSSMKFGIYLQSLCFLKVYTRIGPIQEEESTEWFTSNPGVSVMPEIAKYRLPYRSCPYSTAMIQSEISLNTYARWRTAPSFLLGNSIHNDHICSFAISNLRDTEKPNANASWNLHHSKKLLLEKIDQCVSYIESIETAVAVLYFVVNNVMPPGVDQVGAAQKCYLMADKWRRETRTEAAASKFAKAEKKYFSVSTQHILHASGLGKPEYLALTMEPTRLITELYTDPSIVGNSTCNMPDINNAVEKIMVLHELEPVRIILELLTQWLHPEDALQATLSDSIVQYSEEGDDHNIKRACYMLLGNKHSGEIEKYLVGQAFPKNTDDTSKSHGVRLRALRILMSITTVEKLEIITARDIHTIRSYLQILDFVTELERFGLVYTVRGFEITNKLIVVETLLNYKAIQAVRLALKICQAFSISNDSIISRVLRSMKNLNMVTDLAEFLPDASATAASLELLKECWSYVVDRAVLKADRDSGSVDPLEVQKVADLVYSCPDISFLNVENLTSFFARNDRKVLKYFGLK